MLDSNLHKPDTEISEEKEQEKKEKLLTTIKPHRGHTLFKVDTKTGEISKAKFKQTDVAFEDVVAGRNLSRKKVIVEEGCIYVSALNKKNVIKKLNRKK